MVLFLSLLDMDTIEHMNVNNKTKKNGNYR